MPRRGPAGQAKLTILSAAEQINSDMGEAFGRWQLGPDEEIMKHIDVANVACGFHASDPVTLHKSESS